MDRQKSVLIDCLCRKGIALSRLYMLSKYSNEQDKSVTLEDIGNVWLDLLKFVDVNDSKVFIYKIHIIIKFSYLSNNN